MTDRERKIHVLKMVIEFAASKLLPEEMADLRSLLEDLKGEDGWISVKDRLPDVGDEYNIVWDLEDGEPPVSTTAQWDGIMRIFYDETYPLGIENVLYWQPLPQPPKP